ncbi:MAG: DUF177 domain-containing protein, partial [Pseudomonadales bacterium]|nr:DUF177 domain-containing protein [Pseudomonadales bacterium]
MHLRDLPRLQQCLSDNIDSIVFADLQFGKDEENRRVMNGFLKTELSLQCNRCLQSMTLPMETGFHLAFVWNDEQAAALPKSLEPVFLHEESIDLYEILEDELLLSLPLSPVHASDICQIDQSFPVNPENEVSLGLLSGKQIKKEAERADNPFEVL